LYSIISQRLFANVSVRSARKNPPWILSLKSEETDLMPLPEMVIEQSRMVANAPAEGMRRADEANAHNQV